GLMLLPILLAMPISMTSMTGQEHTHIAMATGIGMSATTGIAAVAVHTAAMLAVEGSIAVVVYRWAGLEFLRRGWINLDLLWVIALVGAGLILLVVALW